MFRIEVRQDLIQLLVLFCLKTRFCCLVLPRGVLRLLKGEAPGYARKMALFSAIGKNSQCVWRKGNTAGLVRKM